jgi:hypothetical protein
MREQMAAPVKSPPALNESFLQSLSERIDEFKAELFEAVGAKYSEAFGELEREEQQLVEQQAELDIKQRELESAVARYEELLQ